MATITATINLTSPDITGDPLNLSKTTNLNKAATATGLDQFTGITTVVYSTAQTAKKIEESCSRNTSGTPELSEKIVVLGTPLEHPWRRGCSSTD